MKSEVLVAMKGKNNFKIAEKLHKQFGHPRVNKLIDLVKKSGRSDDKLIYAIEKVSKNCTVCAKFRKAPNRPVVALPMASHFNDMVATDLKIWGSKYFLVLIDIATRYCTAVVINNKNPLTIITSIMTSWIAIFGPPAALYSDNGREYNNNEFHRFAEAFNITVKTTPAQSPWSNGCCERQNATLGNMVRKIMSDSECSVEVALAWAVAARNSLSNNSGFSPNQLVFGRNPVLPNVFSNKPPAMNTCSNDMVRKNLNAMHSATQEFMKFEANEKINRALRHKVRSTDSFLIQPGDRVFYKRDQSHEWHGPAVVLGRDGKLFMLRHGGMVVRVHECRLCDANDQEPQQSKESDVSRTENMNCESNNSCTNDHKLPECECSDRADAEQSDNEIFEDASEIIHNVRPQLQEPPMRRLNKPLVRVGQRITGTMNNGDRLTGKIHSRSGKATSQYKNCYNIQGSDGRINSVDLGKDVLQFEIVPDEEEVLVVYSSEEVIRSKEVEIENWISNKVFTEVIDEGQDTLSVRWVTTEKIKDGKPKLKSRLVARGFEENTAQLSKHSPTCSKEAVRLTISIAGANGWICNTIDVKSAYLQGKTIEREVYLRPPPEFNDGKLWKLNKTVYGLSDAALQWYRRVKEELLNLGMKVSSLDPALFVWEDSGKTLGILCLYVDDIFWAGKEKFKTSIIDKLCSVFKIGAVSSKLFSYIGLNITNLPDGSTDIDQFEYIESIQPIGLTKGRSNNMNSLINEKERGEYRALIGQLNWVATQTRPDIAFEVCHHSSKVKNATVRDICSLNKVVGRLRNNPYPVHYPAIANLDSCRIEVYSDASFANLSNGGSQGGILIFLSNDNGLRCPIFWESRKIRRVVKSTLAAETLALIDAAEAGVYIKEVVKELINVPMPIICLTDNKSLVDVIDSKKNVDDKRLRIDIAVLKDMLERKEISTIQWVSTTMQLANSLTKLGAPAGQLRAAVSSQ